MNYAIVTGVLGGIGRATAELLLSRGWGVFGMDLPGNPDLSGFSEHFTYVSGDLSAPADRERLVSLPPQLDALVNVAGIAPRVRADLLEMTEESYDRVLGVNTKGSMFFTQLIAKHMIGLSMEGRVKRGTIVNVSSCSADVVSLNRGEYCVSKAGVSMLTKLYAARLAPEGILVHEVRPGVIATDMTTTVQEKYDRLIAQGAFPIARWGTAEDVANAVSLLCSDQLAYTTGNYLDVDGGFHIRVL